MHGPAYSVGKLPDPGLRVRMTFAGEAGVSDPGFIARQQRFAATCRVRHTTEMHVRR